MLSLIGLLELERDVVKWRKPAKGDFRIDFAHENQQHVDGPEILLCVGSGSD